MGKEIVILDDKTRGKDKLKPSEIKFLEEYIRNGGNAIKAFATVKGLDLTDKKEYKRCGVKSTLLMQRLRPTIDEELEAQGLTLKKISEIIFEGLTAYKYDKFGSMYPDFKARHLYLETLCKLKNLFPKGDINVNVNKENKVLIVPGLLSDEDSWLKKLDKVREITDEMRSLDDGEK